MQPQPICFQNDFELAIFLWRTYCPVYDYRTLLRDCDGSAVASLERVIGFRGDWKLSECDIKQQFQTALSGEKSEEIKAALRKGSFHVAAERERGWLEEELDIQIQSTTSSSTFDSSYANELHILCCILSAAMDQNDIWSTTHLLQYLAPETLHVLKNMSREKKMNIVQTLFSYTMEAAIQGNTGSSSVLSSHMTILGSLDKAVDTIHDHLHNFTSARPALSAIVQTAITFMLNLEQWRCSAKVKTVQKVVLNQLRELEQLRQNSLRNSPNDYQIRKSLISPTHVLLRLLLDRVTSSGILPSHNMSMTPVFKTPVVLELTQTPESRGTDESITETITPKTNIGSFLNNSTPTPHRVIPVDELGDLDTTIVHHTQENIDELENEAPPKEKPSVTAQDTPVRVNKKRKSMRDEATNGKQVTKKTTIKQPKKKDADKKSQRTLLTFFNKT